MRIGDVRSCLTQGRQTNKRKCESAKLTIRLNAEKEEEEEEKKRDDADKCKEGVIKKKRSKGRKSIINKT